MRTSLVSCVLVLSLTLIRPAVGAEQHPAVERLRDLQLLAAALVERAASGRTPAHDFQIQARMYREQLRQIMLANRELAPARQLPQPLLLDMVRMSALLHAAADCKSGLIITCPPDLVRQLRAQQTVVDRGLRALPTAQDAS